MAANPNETVVALEREWPRWQVWVVHRAAGGQLWCARRWDDHGTVLNADSADELAEHLEEAAAGDED